jgi:hypothetical protein
MWRGKLERLIDKVREAVTEGYFVLRAESSISPFPRHQRFLYPMDLWYNVEEEEKSHLDWFRKSARQIVMISEYNSSSNGYGFMHNVC